MKRSKTETRKTNALSIVVCGTALAALLSAANVRAEIIDRVLAVLPGQIITLSDVEAALDLGLIDAPADGDRITGALSALIDRMLMLSEVHRVVPPEPPAAAIDARVVRMRARFSTPQEFARALASRGVDDEVVRLHAADDLRLSAYVDERFSGASQPTEEEIRQAGEGAREKLAAERRATLVRAWIAELRRRADVTVVN